VLRGLSGFKVTLFFYFAYVVVNYAYVILFRSEVYNYTAVFLTSPFNLLETASGVYSSPLEGMQENFILVVLFILLAELYSRHAQVSKPKLTITHIFALSIAATYITSALWWVLFGVPSNGTSIIAFCILTYLAAVTLLDRKIYGRKVDGRTPSEQVKALLWMTALVLSILFASTYVIGNDHYSIHLIGVLVFAGLVGLYTTMEYSDPEGGGPHLHTTPPRQAGKWSEA